MAGYDEDLEIMAVAEGELNRHGITISQLGTPHIAAAAVERVCCTYGWPIEGGVAVINALSGLAINVERPSALAEQIGGW
jgi:hypothetical protein